MDGLWRVLLGCWGCLFEMGPGLRKGGDENWYGAESGWEWMEMGHGNAICRTGLLFLALMLSSIAATVGRVRGLGYMCA